MKVSGWRRRPWSLRRWGWCTAGSGGSAGGNRAGWTSGGTGPGLPEPGRTTYIFRERDNERLSLQLCEKLVVRFCPLQIYHLAPALLLIGLFTCSIVVSLTKIMAEWRSVNKMLF